MLILEVLIERGELRFTRLSEAIPGVSYKMLTQTLRSMEREGLIARTVHPVIPPKVEYKLTDLGLSLGAAFCGVWMWAEQHLDEVEQARVAFDKGPRVSEHTIAPQGDFTRQRGRIQAALFRLPITSLRYHSIVPHRADIVIRLNGLA